MVENEELHEVIDLQRNEISLLQYLLEEQKQRNYANRYRKILLHTIYTLVAVAAVAVLIAVLLLPVLKIYGDSMSDTLHDGDIVVSVKGGSFQSGDVVAFYYNNKILVKRVIASAGQWVNIDDDGNVYVDNQLLDEPYVTEKALGECDIELPYQVPDGKVFVMGDHRNVSVDSRSTEVGCVAEDLIVGKLRFCVWPLSSFGKIE